MELAWIYCCWNTSFLKDLEIMKKLIFILTLLFSVASFAQTKEETIEWINTYSGDFLHAKIFDVYEEKHTFSIRVDDYGKTSVFHKTSFSDGYSSEITYNFETKDIIRIKLNEKTSEITVSTQKDAIKKVDKKYGISQVSGCLILANSYEDLNRVYKALVHYAGFFGYKENVAKDKF